MSVFSGVVAGGGLFFFFSASRGVSLPFVRELMRLEKKATLHPCICFPVGHVQRTADMTTQWRRERVCFTLLVNVHSNNLSP